MAVEYFAAGGRLGTAARDAPGLTDAAGGPGDAAGAERGLASEGRALLGALLDDLVALDGVAPVAVANRPSVRALSAGRRSGVEFRPPEGDPIGAAVRAARERPGALLWPVAPETEGRLARWCRRAEEAGVRLVGPGAGGVRGVARRYRLLRRLDREGVRTPTTARAETPRRARSRARELGWPLVIKPGRGAGGAGTTRVEEPGQIEAAWSRAARVEPAFPPLVQPYVDGVPASAVLLCEGGRVRPLALSRQRVRFAPAARYEGGETPLRHPLGGEALTTATGAARAAGELRGLVGVDLVLARGGPVVMEINPRVTTSYLGLREHVGARAAAAALRAAGHRCEAVVPSVDLPLGADGAGPEPVLFGVGTEG